MGHRVGRRPSTNRGAEPALPLPLPLETSAVSEAAR